jgi:hypothetical protein
MALWSGCSIEGIREAAGADASDDQRRVQNDQRYE